MKDYDITNNDLKFESISLSIEAVSDHKRNHNMPPATLSSRVHDQQQPAPGNGGPHMMDPNIFHIVHRKRLSPTALYDEPLEEDDELSHLSRDDQPQVSCISHVSKASRVASRASCNNAGSATPKVKGNFVAETLLGGSQAKNVSYVGANDDRESLRKKS